MRVVLVLAVLAVAGTAVPASTQSLASLAELAAKEAARRAAIKEPARMFTDKDLLASKAPAAKAPPADADNGTPAAAPSVVKQETTPKTDDNGHDERWWSARATPLVQRLNVATRKLEAAKARVERVSIAMNRASGRARAAIEQKLQTAAAEVERLSADVAEARRALEDLEDEARKAGALPGWLRK